MQWNLACLVEIVYFVAVVGNIDFKSLRKICDPPCLHGECINGTCNCQPGWSGSRCESCFGRIRLTEPTGTLTNGPFNYSRNLRCIWLIDGTLNNVSRIYIEVDDFDTECGWDYLYVYDGDGVYSQQLAAVSGLLPSYSWSSKREYVARSGQAYVYFSSDIAFNMSGFNVTYRFDSCPNDCSGHGICNEETGECHCTDGSGYNCHLPPCNRQCESRYGKCQQDGVNEWCKCNSKFRGPFCNFTAGEAVWNVLKTEMPFGVASHAVVIVGHYAWVIGGMSFRSFDHVLTLRYDMLLDEWVDVETIKCPLNRYDHTAVEYGNEVYVFGGIVSGRNVTSELWRLSVKNLTWHHLKHLAGVGAVPVAGHTAHVIGDTMITIFGYNPEYGLLNFVQEYNFLNNSWKIVKTVGARMQGLFGHTSVRDTHSGLIYVYGGYTTASYSSSYVADKLYQYDSVRKRWGLLRSSGFSSLLHSASIISGIMVVFGGNFRNETVQGRANQCYSDVILTYDVECGVWNKLAFPTYLHTGISRYGHRSVVYDGRMYIFGGFDGAFTRQVVQFLPGHCGFYRNKDDCMNSQQGMKCVHYKGRCMNSAEAWHQIKVEKRDSNSLDKVCTFSGMGEQFKCANIADCSTCTSTEVQPCRWCNGRCATDCMGNPEVTKTELCYLNVNCSQFHTCNSCRTYGDGTCFWTHHKSHYYECADIVNEIYTTVQKTESKLIAEIPSEDRSQCYVCSHIDNCADCTRRKCIWCATLNRCIDLNSFIISFPYGQCAQWLNNEDQCAKISCSSFLTCSSCQLSSAHCGWCDDGSRTGLGLCMPGSDSGPVEWDIASRSFRYNGELCPSKQWYFIGCPECQCNGHGTCANTTTTGETDLVPLTCLSCQDKTTGPHCERCIDGYYGNALNGGNCTPCDCNRQATQCDPYKGNCFCTTKGVSGFNCDKCEQKYIGDPRNQTCYYELTVDFVFTFNLNSEDDAHITQINFVTRPPKENTDVSFKLSCTSIPGSQGKVNLTVTSATFTGNNVRRFLLGSACHEIERRFSADEFSFGTDANTTFFIFLYDFKTPIIIQISFAQTPTIDWMKFFITFALCFFILLVVAFALWKIKQRFDVYQRRQRMFVEMAQMASRPFASVELDLSMMTPGSKQAATQVAVEPCSNYRAGVVTVAVRLPTGGRKYVPNGQSGFAVASALCFLTPNQLAQLQTPPSPAPQPKAKRKRPPCLFSSS